MTFVDFTTPVPADWLNFVNQVVNSTIPVGTTSVTSIAALRNISKTSTNFVNVAGYYGLADGGGGLYAYNSGDVTTPDNGGTIIVAADGGRWYLCWDGLFVPEMFGAKGDGVTDDSAAFAAALSNISNAYGGGNLMLTRGKNYYIGSNLTIPRNTCVIGPYTLTGSPGNNSSTPYNQVGAIQISSAVSITLSSGSGITGCLIYRHGMTFPAGDSTAFAGTAIIGNGDDIFMEGCMILGFAQGFYGTNCQRVTMNHIYHDNIAGIHIDTSHDVDRLFQCHAWPFSTIASSGSNPNWPYRSGVAYNFTTAADAAVVIDCFAMGYQTGFQCQSANGVRFIGCDAEHFNITGTVGYKFTQGSTDGHLTSCNTFACDIGVFVDLSLIGGQTVHVTDCTIHGDYVGTIGIEAASGGDINVVGGEIVGVNNAVYINNTTSNVILSPQTLLQNINNSSAIAGIGGSAGLYLPPQGVFWQMGTPGLSQCAGGFQIPNITAAATLVLPVNGTYFNLQGTTTINTGISGGFPGRQIVLKSQNGITINAGGTGQAAVRLTGSTVTLSAGGTLSLMHDGFEWYETGRAT